MFKLFRAYEKYILAFGVTALMFIFLIQGTLQSFLSPDPGSTVIATVAGNHKITLNDQRNAEFDLDALSKLAPVLALGQARGNQESLRWLLMLQEARSMGLEASNNDVAIIENQLGLGGDDEALAQQLQMRNLNISKGQIDRAIRDWDVVQQYQELVYGLGHLTAEQRLARLEEAMMMLQYLGQNGMSGMLLNRINQDVASARGLMRVSEPLLSHLVQEVMSRATIAAVSVPTGDYLAKVQPPKPEELQRLFDQYRQHLPGESDEGGYTLGYKTPDRVKIEYLAVPYERLRAREKVDEVDILTYYDAHRQEFRPAPAAPPAGTTQPAVPAAPGVAPPVPDDAARNKIIEKLKDQRAAEESQRIIKAAEAILVDQTRSLKEADGYRVLPTDWAPKGLEGVATEIQQQFGVLPDVKRIDDHWMQMSDLGGLPGIGAATVDGTRGSPLAAYVQSTKELNPKPDDALAILHLQVGVPSQPLTGQDGSHYLFRLIAAEPARVPPKLEEVIKDVERDARRLAAYKLIQADKSHWSVRLEEKPLSELAKELGSPLLTPGPFPRRQLTQTGPTPPDITGIGRDAGFTDGVFALAARIALRGDIKATPPAQRSEPIGSNANLTLILVRVDDLQSITRSQFEREAGDPSLGALVQDVLTTGKSADALSIDALKKRLSYVSARGEKDEGTQPTAPQQPAAPYNPLD